METNLKSGSVIAKLMGFDEPPSQYPAMKKQRVLSEKYLQKIALIGVRENRSISGLQSVRCNSPDTKKTVVGAGYHLGNDNIDNSLDLRESRGILDVNVEFCHNYFLKPQNLFMKQQLQNDPSYSGEDAADFCLRSSGIGKRNVISRKSSSLTEGKYVHSLQTSHDEIQRSVHENSGPRRISRFSRTKLEPKDGLFLAQRFSASNSHSGKSENSIGCFFLPGSREVTNMVPALNNCFSSLHRISTEVNKTNKLGSQMNAGNQSSNISEISEKPQEWNVAHNFSRKLRSSELSVDRKSERLESLSTTYGKRKYYPSSSTSLDGLKTGIAEKKTSEAQKVAENSEVGLLGQRITHGEFRTRPYYKSGRTKSNYDLNHILRYKKCSSFPEANLSAKNRDNSKVRQIRKAASFTSNGFRSKSKDGPFGLKLENSSTRSSYKSDNQNSHRKLFPPFRTFRSGAQGSLSVLSVESNTTEANTCIQHGIMKEHCKDDISDLCLCKKKDEIIMSELGDDVMPHDVASNAKTEVSSDTYGNQQDMQYEMTPIDLCTGDYICPFSHSSVQQETLSDIQDTGSLYSSCLDSDPDSLLNFHEACHSSPISVLDSTFGELKYSCSGCFEAAIDDFYASENDCQEPEMNISSDEDSGEETGDDTEENDKIFRPLKVEESRDFSYLLEVLNESGFYKWNPQTITCTWHSPECPISPFVFEALEKKFGQQTSWMRSERRLIFDRINLGLTEIIQPCLGVPTWKMPVVRRLNPQVSHDMIEKELWAMLSVPAKETSNNTEELFAYEFRTDLGEDIDTIARDIVQCLVDELAEEIVE